MKDNNGSQFILLSFFGMFGSIIIGFIFYNTFIFIPTRTTFQFVILGFIGAFTFSLFEYRSLREQIFGMIFIFILNLVLTTGKSISTAYVMRDIFFLGSIFLSMKLYHLFIKKYSGMKYYLRSFGLVLIYCLTNVFLGSALFLINSNWQFPTLSFLNMVAGHAILIGLGIGLGIDFYFQNRGGLASLLKIKAASE